MTVRFGDLLTFLQSASTSLESTTKRTLSSLYIIDGSIALTSKTSLYYALSNTTVYCVKVFVNAEDVRDMHAVLRFTVCQAKREWDVSQVIAQVNCPTIIKYIQQLPIDASRHGIVMPLLSHSVATFLEASKGLFPESTSVGVAAFTLCSIAAFSRVKYCHGCVVQACCADYKAAFLLSMQRYQAG